MILWNKLCGPETDLELNTKTMIIEDRSLYDVNFSQKVRVTQHGMLPVDECIHSIGRITAGVFTGLAGFPSFRPVLPSALSLPFTFDTAGS